MKTWKQRFIGIIAIIALAITACDDGSGNKDTHTHEYSTTWSKNATQHWYECSCGEKTAIANHTFSGSVCTVCNYTHDGQLPADLFSFPGIVYPVEMYYGADLGKFPPAARNFIKNTQFTEERMNLLSRLNHTISVWWSENNNSVRMSATYTLAPGYTTTVDGVTYKAGDTVTWGTNANYSGSSSIFAKYGEYAKFKTLRFKYVYSLYTQTLIKNDPAYNEIIAFAKQLCDEFEYDWSNYDAYTGAAPVKTPGKTYVVCAGYAKAVMEEALSLDSVAAVQRWTTPTHAWNVLELVDGRLLYFDLTWFDNEHINEETGAIYQTDDYGWENITFYKELFDYSNVSYGTGVFSHAAGEFHSVVRK